MFKRLALMTMAATILAATPAYAGQWMQDGNGWWWQNDNGSYPAFTWAWCDGNHDGIGAVSYTHLTLPTIRPEGDGIK